MKKVHLLFVALAPLSLCSVANAVDWLFHGDKWQEKPSWMSKSEEEGFYAARFRAYRDTVIWYHITLTCPSSLFCAQFFYLRPDVINRTSLLEYTDVSCTETNVLKHKAMVVMNFRDETEVMYTPNYLVLHNCNSSELQEYYGNFTEIRTGDLSDQIFDIDLSLSNDTLDDDHLVDPWQRDLLNTTVYPNLVPHFDPSIFSEPLFLLLHPFSSPSMYAEHFHNEQSVYSVLHPINHMTLQIHQPKDFDRCRAVNTPEYILCSKQVYGESPQPLQFYYSPNTDWTSHYVYNYPVM